MQFRLASLAHFATEDLIKSGEFVKALGLGGQMVYDYTANMKQPKLDSYSQDYLEFYGISAGVGGGGEVDGEGVGTYTMLLCLPCR